MNAEFAKALAAFQAECPVIAKATEGRDGNRTYKYADLPTIMDQIRPLMKEHGLWFSCQPRLDDAGGFLEAIVGHISGEETLTASMSLSPNLNIKQLGSEITYKRRYLLSAMLNLVTDLDDDGDAAQKGHHQQAPDTPQSTHDSRSASWAGPLTKTELKKQVHDLSRNLEAAVSLEEVGFLRRDYESVIAQVIKDVPEWWSGMVRDGEIIPGLEQRFADVEARVNDIEQGAGVVQ